MSRMAVAVDSARPRAGRELARVFLSAACAICASVTLLPGLLGLRLAWLSVAAAFYGLAVGAAWPLIRREAPNRRLVFAVGIGALIVAGTLVLIGVFVVALVLLFRTAGPSPAD